MLLAKHWLMLAMGLSALVACASSTDGAKASLGASCKSADECDDVEGTQLRWCCPTATDGRANVCRATNCYAK